MVIDTSGKKPSNTKASEDQNTKVIKEVKIVEHQVPKELRILFNNLNQLLDLSSNHKEILEVAKNLENNLKELSNIDIESIKKLPINEILKVASKTNDISKLSLIKKDIEKISKLDRELINMSTISDEIKQLSRISGDIPKVNNMSDAIEVISNYEKELMKLYESLDEILLVEQELSYVIQLAKLLNGYKKFITDNSLTDTDIANFIKSIEQNISEISIVSNNIEEIKKLNDKINQTPDILQQYQDKLDLLALEAKTRFNQLVVDGIERIEEAIRNGEKELIDLAHQLKVLIGNGGGGGGSVTPPDLSNYATISYVDNKYTQLDNKINQIKQEILLELENYAEKEYVDQKTGNTDQLATTAKDLTNAVNELKTRLDAGGGGATPDLTDYAKKNEENTFTQKQHFNNGADISIEPTNDNDVVNKKYVDDTFNNIDLSNVAKKNEENTFEENQTFNKQIIINARNATENPGSTSIESNVTKDNVNDYDLGLLLKDNDKAKGYIGISYYKDGNATASLGVFDDSNLPTAVISVHRSNNGDSVCTATSTKGVNDEEIITLSYTGKISELLTNVKDNIVNAINELYTRKASKDEANTFTENQTFNKNLISDTAPTQDNHITNKKYVDDLISNIKIPKLKVLDDVTFIESDIKEKGEYMYQIDIESNKYISILDIYIEDTINQCIVSVPYDVIIKDNKSIIFLDVENVKKITYLEIDI